MTFDLNNTPSGDGQPQGQSPVWPPPASTGPAPIYPTQPPSMFPFKYVHERYSGNIADFREGSFGVSPAGLLIQGRAQPKAEIYQTVLVLSFLFCYGILGASIAYLIMRYACLRNETCQIPWNQVRAMVTVPEKNKLCIVYEPQGQQLDYQTGMGKTYCLTMSFSPDDYAGLMQTTESYAPHFAQPGKLRSATSIVVWVFVILVLVFWFGMVAIGAMKFLGSTSHPQPGF